MEVDHFNPILDGDKRHEYANLYLASRHCNLAKRDNWPDEEDARAGLRFLDPCSERDYSVLILEEEETGDLVGTTPAAKWHIGILLLNAPQLKAERRERTILNQRRKEIEAILATLGSLLTKEKEAEFRKHIRELKDKEDQLISKVKFTRKQLLF